MKLTAGFVKATKEPGTYGDGRGGHGLTLRVQPGAAGPVKSWYQRLHQRNIGLGAYPAIGLAEARGKALANVAGGVAVARPVTQHGPTFADCLEPALETLRTKWRGQREEDTFRAFMTTHALPAIGRKPIADITSADVLKFLTPLAHRTPAVAKRLKGYLSLVFKWAIAQSLRETNPANGDIDIALPKLTAKAHHRALPYSDIGAALATLDGSPAHRNTKLALRFLALTGTRSGEVRQMTWAEVDGNTWTIPATHTKTDSIHRVALSGPAMAILEQARAHGGDGLAFPSKTGKVISDNTLSKAMRDNNIPGTPHGFRSGFRDWAAETGVDRQVAEVVLGHAQGGAVETAYLRTDRLEERRAVMQAWGEYLDTTTITP